MGRNGARFSWFFFIQFWCSSLNPVTASLNPMRTSLNPVFMLVHLPGGIDAHLACEWNKSLVWARVSNDSFQAWTVVLLLSHRWYWFSLNLRHPIYHPAAKRRKFSPAESRTRVSTISAAGAKKLAFTNTFVSETTPKSAGSTVSSSF